MKSVHLRLGIVGAFLGFLFFFFVPVMYDAALFACRNLCATSLTNPAGLKSLGYWVFNWGATYGFDGASYTGPIVANTTTFSDLFTVVFPLAVASVCLMAPEIVEISRTARASFVSFGVFTLGFSLLLGLNGALPPHLLPLMVVGACLAPVGGAIAVYGLRPSMF